MPTTKNSVVLVVDCIRLQNTWNSRMKWHSCDTLWHSHCDVRISNEGGPIGLVCISGFHVLVSIRLQCADQGSIVWWHIFEIVFCQLKIQNTNTPLIPIQYRSKVDCKMGISSNQWYYKSKRHCNIQIFFWSFRSCSMMFIMQNLVSIL